MAAAGCKGRRRHQFIPAQEARGMSKEPGVDAIRVVAVAAPWQHPQGVVAAELCQAHGALPCLPSSPPRGSERHEQERSHRCRAESLLLLLLHASRRILLLLLQARAEGDAQERADDEEGEYEEEDLGEGFVDS